MTKNTVVKNTVNHNITIFFGNKNNCTVSHKSKEFESFCDKLAQDHGLTRLIFSEQVHGSAGTYIDTKEKAEYIKSFGPNRSFDPRSFDPRSFDPRSFDPRSFDPRSFDLEKSSNLVGDFLITNQKNIGIGVLTADCLPIIFYDTKNHVAACIHAGWRSSVAEIVTKAVQMMFEKFKFAPEDLQIYFGPCAKACCYQIQPDFLENLKNFKFKNQVIRKVSAHEPARGELVDASAEATSERRLEPSPLGRRADGTGDTLFFDNVLFNKLLLIDLGMLSKNMNFENNECTMCTGVPGTGKPDTSKFHSYRRDGELSSRQISFIALK